MEHDEYCNCEGCWWARDCHEVCGCCGSVCDEYGHCSAEASDESSDEEN